jgi:hypothetical protein
MWVGILTLATALIISVSAAYYSILGLTAIFASAFWPIVILGSSLEVGKIVSTLWLHKYWRRAEIQYKIYLSTAVAILMVLTSMGVFGFLSKAHLDQAVPSGDIQAQVQIYDDKIKTQRDNIEAARKALRQMDEAVDQTMSRSSSEQGADKAANLRRSQARERGNLQNDITRAQTEIVKLQEQRAPVASQARQVEAEVGPIKYIAALIYGDNPDANLLEKAVRWVIILIVIVFDPLALTLLLAATKTFEWERENRSKDHDEELDPEVRSWFDRARERARFWDQQRDQPKPEPWPFPRQFEGIRSDSGEWTQTGPEFDVPDEQAPAKSQQTVRQAVLAGLDNMWTRAKKSVKQDAEAEHAPLQNQPNTPSIGFTNKIRNVWDHFSEQLSSASTEVFTADSPEKIAERAWKSENPDSTLKSQRELLKKGKIDQLPWKQPEFLDRIAGLEINTGYGKTFPANPSKGDMFVKIDTLPSVLHKFNGTTWMQLDKDNSDTYTQNTAYIDYLIEKISTGEYDPELLSESERISIEQRLNQII